MTKALASEPPSGDVRSGFGGAFAARRTARTPKREHDGPSGAGEARGATGRRAENYFIQGTAGKAMASASAGLDTANATVAKDAPGAKHAFIYRPRLDGNERVLVWTRGGKEKRFPSPDVSRAKVAIADPAGQQKRDLDFIVSGSFAWDVTLLEEDVAALGLDRWSVPGRAIPKDGSTGTFRKVRCRIQVPEIDLDEMAIAFVLP